MFLDGLWIREEIEIRMLLGRLLLVRIKLRRVHGSWGLCLLLLWFRSESHEVIWSSEVRVCYRSAGRLGFVFCELEDVIATCFGLQCLTPLLSRGRRCGTERIFHGERGPSIVGAKIELHYLFLWLVLFYYLLCFLLCQHSVEPKYIVR